MLSRLWQYQKERFPVFAHGILLLVVTLGTLGFASWQLGQAQFASAAQILVGFGTVFVFFFQLRVADEFKDFEEDSQFRPERPVPRGLISLKTLTLVALCGAGLQIAMNALLNVQLLVYIAMVWGYMLLMRVEFFAPEWLKTHPVVYLVSHMLIMPLIYLYLVAVGVDGASSPWLAGWVWLFAAVFFNGIVIEVGRKIRAPEQEQTGVETYSALWGDRVAVTVWVIVMLLSGVGAVLALQSNARAESNWIAMFLAMAWLTFALVGGLFAKQPTINGSQRIETLSGLWALVLHFAIGLLPWWLAG